jgi:hypothetical protein
MNRTDFAPSFMLSSRVKLGDLIRPGNKLVPIAGLTIQQIVSNLSLVATNIIEPVYDMVGGPKGIIITSGFRSKLPPGGSSTSYHFKGLACDFVLAGKNFNADEHFKFANMLVGSGLGFDKVLLEYREPGKNGNNSNNRLVWVHVQIAGETGGRKEVYTLVNDKTYSKGLTNLA